MTTSGLFSPTEVLRRVGASDWVEATPTTLSVEYFIIGGGGGGGGTANNVAPGGDGGRVATAITTFDLVTPYVITVGAGGTGGAGGLDGNASSTNGGQTIIGTVSTVNGGLCGANTRCCPSVTFGGTGGASKDAADQYPSGGTGGNPASVGLTTTITGSSLIFGQTWSSAPLDTTPRTATANFGQGGQAPWSNANRAGGNGSSGRIILKYPDTRTATFSGGVTHSTSTSGGFKITTITATSTTSETVTFS